MNSRIVVTPPALPGLARESIDANDLEPLRRWKNVNLHRFFHREEITPEGQSERHSSYRMRPDDWMFLIRSRKGVAGRVVCRSVDGAADSYKVLRKPALNRRSTANSLALDLMTNYIEETHQVPIRARVLTDNPAHRWARARSFRIISQGVNNGLVFNLLEQDPLDRAPYPVAFEHAGGPSGRTREACA